MDRKIRKLLTLNKMHHPKADVNRTYVPRRDWGRGMINLEIQNDNNRPDLLFGIIR